MNVIALRQDAVFVNAGSYVIIPKSSSLTLILRRSMARIVSSWMGTSYVLPVRLSVIVRVSAMLSYTSSFSGSPSGSAEGGSSPGTR